MRLNEIQKNFKDTILDAQAQEGGFRGVFKQDGGISFENRMKVYRNNVIRSLSDTVLAAFPMSAKLVGKDFLKQAARAYVVENLPQQGNINLYGDSFPAFLKMYEPARSVSYLYDVARLEWAWEVAYYAADDAALDPEALAVLAEENLPRLSFSFRESFALIESDFPLDEIVDYCRDEYRQEIQSLSERGCKLMVFRPNLTVEMRTVEDNEYAFLKALQQGKTIEQAVPPDFDLAGSLQKYLLAGIFSGFETREGA